MALSNYEKFLSYKQRRKEDLVYISGGKCSICGYHRCINALEFHHINPEQKEMKISCNGGMAFEKQITEIKKCVLVCANCHREIHSFPWEFKDLKTNYSEDRYLEVVERKKRHKKEIVPPKRICKRPDRETLKEKIRKEPFLKVAKYFDVTDNAIRKWCKFYKLPHKVEDIRKISDADWENI